MICIEIVLLAAGVVLAVPSTFLLIECLTGIRAGSLCIAPLGLRNPRMAVVIPAHDEESIIADTVRSVSGHLREEDRLLVVADNCRDDTAKRARAAGAEVIERCDENRRGKGYALAHGIRHLAADPPAVVVFLDADTALDEGSFRVLSELAAETDRPVQGLYLFAPPACPLIRDLVSAFALKIKNMVRARGLYRLANLCHLTGSGMAFPWQLAKTAPLNSNNLVEDMQLGIDLAIQGSCPLLCEVVRVSGVLPQESKAARVQRTRWEHGHLRTLFTQVPRLVIQALRQKRTDLALLGLDLVIPPAALLVIWLICLAAASMVLGAVGSHWGPLFVIGLDLALVLAAIAIAWWQTARQDTPAWVLLLVPLYLLWKVPIYARWCFHPQKEWTRTPR